MADKFPAIKQNNLRPYFCYKNAYVSRIDPAMLVQLLVAFTVLNGAHGLKILGVFPYPGPSHFICFEPLMKALAEKGHEVTVVSHFPQKNGVGNYTDIVLEDSAAWRDVVDIPLLPKTFLKYFETMKHLKQLLSKSCDHLSHPEVIKLLDPKRTFDVIVIETWISDCFLGLVHKLGAPFVGISSTVSLSWSNWRLKNPINPSYIPLPTSPFAPTMSFLERVANVLMLLYEKYTFEKWLIEPGYARATEVFGDLPQLEAIARNVSLLLVNSHFTLQGARPLVPNVVEIGGMFVQKAGRNLPKVGKFTLRGGIEKFIPTVVRKVEQSRKRHGAPYRVTWNIRMR